MALLMPVSLAGSLTLSFAILAFAPKTLPGLIRCCIVLRWLRRRRGQGCAVVGSIRVVADYLSVRTEVDASSCLTRISCVWLRALTAGPCQGKPLAPW